MRHLGQAHRQYVDPNKLVIGTSSYSPSLISSIADWLGELNMGWLGLGWALMVNSSGDVAISPTGGISFPPDPLDQGVTAALDPTEGVYCWVLSARFASIGRQSII